MFVTMAQSRENRRNILRHVVPLGAELRGGTTVDTVEFLQLSRMSVSHAGRFVSFHLPNGRHTD